MCGQHGTQVRQGYQQIAHVAAGKKNQQEGHDRQTVIHNMA
jgi:hypothetical protein